MRDRPIDVPDPFETRLTRDLRSLSAVALRSVDAIEVARGLPVAGAHWRARVVSVPGLASGGPFGSRPRLQGFVAGLAAAAVVLAMAGLGASLLTLRGGVLGPTSSSPSPSTSPSIGRPVVDLAEIRSGWTSIGNRQDPYQNGNHIIMVDHQVTITIGPAGLSIPTFHSDPPYSSIALQDAGSLQLDLRSSAIGWNCTVGDVASYAAELSPDGQILILTSVRDACAVRAAILDGEWRRTDIGPLAATADAGETLAIVIQANDRAAGRPSWGKR